MLHMFGEAMNIYVYTLSMAPTARHENLRQE